VIKESKWPDIAYDSATLESARDILKEEQSTENDRIKAVEAKLISLLSMTPVAMAVVVSGFTILASGRLEAFTRTSILTVGVLAGYIAIQLLRAVIAATVGLARRSFLAIKLEDLYPRPRETKNDYIRRNCVELSEVIRGNRSEIDSKVTALAHGHRAVENAMVGLLLLLITVIALAVSQSS
jgi:hypothetical protein